MATRKVAQNNRRFCHQYRKWPSAISFISLCTAFTINEPLATELKADYTVNKLLSHGSVAEMDIPASYGVFDGSLYYGQADKLFRLDNVDTPPVEITLPRYLGRGLNIRPTFMSYNGALFFHATRRHLGKQGVFLHKLATHDGIPVTIDIPEEPETAAYGWIFERGYPDDSRSFALFEGKLYFFAARAIPAIDFINFSHALYRLDSRDDDPVRVEWEDYFQVIDPQGLRSTTLGLVFRATRPGNARMDELPVTHLYNIRRPRDSQTTTAPALDYRVASAKRASPSANGRELVVFDGHLFYAGEHDGMKTGPVNKGPGPFRDPGRITAATDRWQTELYRYMSRSGSVYYDLHSLTRREAIRQLNAGRISIGSSQPEHFVVANDRFYFVATDDGINSTLYNMASATTKPAPVTFNEQALTDVVPHGEFHRRLWLTADTGQGLDLHYVNDSGRLVPMKIGENAARSARAFTEYRSSLVFTARDENDEWWTYVLSDDGAVSSSAEVLLSSKVTINGNRYPEAPGFTQSVGDRVDIRCRINNRHGRRMSELRVSLRRRNRFRYPTPPTPDPTVLPTPVVKPAKARCSFANVLPGKSVSCRLAPTVQAGTDQFVCVGFAKFGRNSGVRVTGSAYLTGQ